MVTNRRVGTWWLSVAALMAIAVGLIVAYPAQWAVRAQTSSNPNNNFPPFDFSDSFYAENGVNVEPGSPLNTAGGRVGIPGHNGAFGFPNPPAHPLNWVAEPGVNTDPTRTDAAHVLQTTGGFDKDANLIYYSIMGTLNDDSFFTHNPDGTLNEAGMRALTLATDFRAFISPKQFVNNNGHFGFRPCGKTTQDPGTGGSPGADPNNPCWVASPAPPNRRMDNIFETRDTYFCQNLLGLWRLAFLTYTSKAVTDSGTFASRDARAVLTPLANLNGTNLDGTPVLERLAEIDGLTALGYAAQFDMPNTPHKGAPRYVV